MNSGCRSARGGVSRGFTLIEAVLAISISALVMFGGVALLFDMSKLSESLEMGGSLKSHADGVEGFLRSAFSTSSVQSSGDLGETFASNSDKTVYVSKNPDTIGSGDWLLAYGCAYDHPFYVSPTGFSPEKLCWLEYKGGVLSVIWKFVKSEEHDQECALYRSEISRRVANVEYWYYDDVGAWQLEPQLRDTTTGSTMPQYVKITFSDGAETDERLIRLDNFTDGGIK